MSRPTNQIDMAQMNAAINKDFALPASPKTGQNRSQRNAEHPPPAESAGTMVKNPTH